ncbi:hypothetical protein KUTeg_019186 [Tegillarca granosa]|uniref:Exosome complex exonuclease RRP44 n=1 Tax=Tegillarca granosa TaxID=220873 RepID=A0ABQ9EH88_TEGGR|nr:hypothetical protein KUTeg_019186 [Tegillarca granosa]
MLTTKTFIKKTKKGGILKIVREHYLRDDITCGSEICEKCDNKSARPLQENPVNKSDVCKSPHYLIPDTNVVLHQIDVLEDSAIQNVIILQTVLDEVRHRSAPGYKRLKDALYNPDKHFYTFYTYVERQPGETANDRNDRAIREGVKWYHNHLSSKKMSVVLVTNDAENKRKASEEGLNVFTIHEYVKSLRDSSSLVDRLAQSGQNVSYRDKVEFPEHLSLSVIQKGIKSGKYVQGSYMASRENYLEAYVSVHDGDKMIFIQGHMNLNRAIHSDIVAVEMLPEDEWSCPSSLVLEEKEEKVDEENIEMEDEKVKKRKIPKELQQPTGRIVGIIKRNWRQYCGIIRPSTTRHLVIPAERRIPRIRIETRQAADLASQRIVVAIDSWPRNSRYPNGHFVKKLGTIGDKETENEVLLLEHDVPHSNFSEAVLSCLPKLPWVITEEDMKHRQDLRHIDVCSVDPPGCTDIDDALHCRELENGNLERIDMVPELLSSNLCSLRCDVDRFAFSTLWEMTHDAEVVKVWFTKSVIFSRASLTYAEAQMRIDDKSMNDNITKSLRHLNKLAKILKRNRISNGETNSMVEEFMLLANVYTAKKTLEEFPDCAMLRRHPSPPPSNFDPLIKAAESKGFKMDVSCGKALADSLEKAVIPADPYFNTMLRIMATRCMMQAVYSDIIVHRLLAVCIGADASYPSLTDKHKTQTLCNNLNYRHKMAQYAGRASVNLHTHNALQILIPKYGLEGTLRVHRHVVKQYSPVFHRVIVQISIDQSNVQHLKLSIKLVEPVIPGFSVAPAKKEEEEDGPPRKKVKT